MMYSKLAKASLAALVAYLAFAAGCGPKLTEDEIAARNALNAYCSALTTFDFAAMRPYSLPEDEPILASLEKMQSNLAAEKKGQPVFEVLYLKVDGDKAYATVKLLEGDKTITVGKELVKLDGAWKVRFKADRL